MSIDTTKQIKSVTYNGTEIPLAASGGLEFVDVSFKDTNFEETYIISSLQPDGTWSVVANNVQLTYTAKIFSVCKQGFAVYNPNYSYGGNGTRRLFISGLTDIYNNKLEYTHIFYVTGDNPTFLVEEG